MLGADHLTGETAAQLITHPGQAHFAIPGDQRICRDCWFWSPRRHTDMKAICGKTQALMGGRGRPVAVPRYATACKHFAAEAPAADGG